MLVLKLVLVPLILAVLSLVGKRFGPGIAGWLGGFPVVAGPVLLLIYFERGPEFATQAAAAAIAGLVGSAAFSVTYAWTCRRNGWLVSMIAGIAGWTVAIFLVAQLPITIAWVSLVAALAALLAAPGLFPHIDATWKAVPLPRSEIAARMAAGAALTLAVTGLSATIGPAWSGLLTLFPSIGMVLAVFSQRTSGPAFSAMLLKAIIFGYYSLATFCFVFATLLPQQGLALSFGAGVVVALAIGALTRAAPALRKRPA
jgi:hypothetical protein